MKKKNAQRERETETIVFLRDELAFARAKHDGYVAALDDANRRTAEHTAFLLDKVLPGLIRKL